MSLHHGGTHTSVCENSWPAGCANSVRVTIVVKSWSRPRSRTTKLVCVLCTHTVARPTYGLSASVPAAFCASGPTVPYVGRATVWVQSTQTRFVVLLRGLDQD